MSISENITAIRKDIPQHVQLVAVSKTKPAETIMEAYRAGQKVFGENKVQELVSKFEELPKDIEWHFIGHLQTNKVKYIAPFVALIHGIDSLKLLKTIDREGRKNNRVIPCLLQFHIAEEETKYGLNMRETTEIVGSENFRKMKNVSIRGVMGMATFTDDSDKIRNEFRSLKNSFESLRKEYFSDSVEFNQISMGMSDDYPIAVEEGSTIIRVGSKIFGARNYKTSK